MPTPTVYEAGHVKRDPATGNVALRTIFPEDDPMMASQAWLLATPNRGAVFLRTSDVTSWPDLYTPTSTPPPADEPAA